MSLGQPVRIPIARIHDLLHPDDRDRTQAAVDQAVTTDGAFNVEFRSRMPDGSYKWRRGRGRIRKIGASRRLIGAIIDIEHERGILDQLAHNAERLALAEEVAGFGVWGQREPDSEMQPGVTVVQAVCEVEVEPDQRGDEEHAAADAVMPHAVAGAPRRVPRFA